MTVSKTEFVKNYINLISQVDKNDLGKVIRFCSLFNTDDIELYNKFKNSSQSLEEITSSELFNKLEPFHGDKKGSKVYYSNKPILNARYGSVFSK